MSRKKTDYSPSVFGKNLKRLRNTLGYTQGRFGEMIGKTGGYISDLERGKADKPSETLILAIENKFNTKREWLFTEDKSPPFSDNRYGPGPKVPIGVNEKRADFGAEPPSGKWRLLEMAERVLDSDTEYRAALSQNIRAFHSAVSAAEKIEQQAERLESMEHRLIALENRNTGSEG